FVELLIAGHLRRHMVGGRQPALVVVARAAPFREIVGRGALDRRGQCRGAADPRHVAGVDRDIEGAADKAAATLEYRDPLGLVPGAGIDVVDAGLQDPHRAARQINFDAFAFEQLAYAQIDPALRHRQLHDLLVELGGVRLVIAGYRDRAPADAEFGA